MISVAADPSLKWAETCDRVRSHIQGLPANAGCFIFPSVEAALIEIAVLLADREREIGGERNVIVYGHQQDPAIDRMAKTISSTGIEAKPKTDADWAQVETWLAEIKAKALLIAHSEDDRFTGRVYDIAQRKAAFFKDGNRIPVLSLCFSAGVSQSALNLPRSFEIRIYPVDGSSAAIALVGERLRLDPRMAPISMDPLRLMQIDDLFAERAQVDANSRSEIEAFEAALPSPFKPWWPKGASRMLDRAIITSKEHDGFFVVEKIRESLGKSMKTDADKSRLETGLFSLSGCAMNDERRQEWLRARGDDAWLIRGCVHISRELIHTASAGAILSALGSIK